ncbi:MAG: hypothetical protein EON91_02615 [Brevundimonas sp.]|uniref:hypothetical protein n=1 Tax=Brevundimonas sp. TaxID=1871086 RepID=UPI0011FE6946|nr:hypothetical protein [Brevundimonas sp.]RZJ19106.1 MAG: hypothetical protein EON91_02615 [Brevundimonas sp.]
MSAEIIDLVARRPAPDADAKQDKPIGCWPGDIIVACLNATQGIWMAWPVAVVDCEGFVLGVRLKDGRLYGAERVSCEPTVLGMAAADHDPEGFAALRWQSFTDPLQAIAAFSAVRRR